MTEPTNRRDTIRLAAAQIRERAGQATPGRRTSFFGQIRRADGRPLMLTTTAGDYGDAVHLAPWTPELTELVADLLDAADEWSGEPGFEAAHALAAAYLGPQQ